MISTSTYVRVVLITALLATQLASFHGITNATIRTTAAAPINLRKVSAAAEQISAAARCPNPYTVRSGDTLSKIAARCGVSTAYLRQLNGLRSNAVWVGQSLITRAPRSRRSPATPVPAVPRPTPSIESTVSPW